MRSAYASRFPEDAEVVERVFRTVDVAETVDLPELDRALSNTHAGSGDTDMRIPPEADVRSAAVPSEFGDLEILEEISRGEMGVVYRARQRNLNRTVALKMILAGQLASGEEVERFYSEAESAAILDHPGIVPVYEVGQCAGQHFIAMAYVSGDSLSIRLKDGPV